MLSNAYFLAKFRFDTAENEPAKNLQNFPNFREIPFLEIFEPSCGLLPRASERSIFEGSVLDQINENVLSHIASRSEIDEIYLFMHSKF